MLIFWIPLNIKEVSGTRTTGDAGILVVTGIVQLSHGAFIHLVNASWGRPKLLSPGLRWKEKAQKIFVHVGHGQILYLFTSGY